MKTRKARLEYWDRTAPDGAHRIGFGGMAYAYETAVYSWRGMEIRFPFRPSTFQRLADKRNCGMDAYTEIAHGYGCLSAPDWGEIIDQLADLDEEVA